MSLVRRLFHGFLLELLIGYSPLLAANYYVAPGGSNGNSGTSSGQAWATLQYAANRVGPGDTVNVLPGNYIGFDLRTSGVAGAPIRFHAQPGVVINQVNPVTTRDGINIENASHIVIDGFTLNSPSSTTRAGIRVVGDGFGFEDGQFSEFVSIRNNTTTNWGKWGILSGFSHDLLIENNRTSGSVDEHGIYVSNSGDRPIIRGNIVFGNRANGIHMNGDLFTGDPDVSPDVDGIISSPRVENNIIYGNGAGGGSAINGDGVVDARIVNNLLYANQASGISLYRIDGGSPSTGGEIINNTIINASNARWVINLRDGSTGATIFNNILFNLNGSSLRGSIGAFDGSHQGLKSDYNLVDPRFSMVEGNSSINLATWTAGTGNDQHSLALTLAQMQALFSDYGSQDLTLAGSSVARDFGVASLINGSAVFAPQEDLLGAQRPMGSRFDAGAYEYFVSPPSDCDFNGDGICSAVDLNQLLALGPIAAGVSANGNELFDLDGNGTINMQDNNLWLALAAAENGFASPYKPGDANLDGRVDGSDFGLWNAHKFTPSLRWDYGNFNGDAVTDGSDFSLWNANKFTASDGILVPEPRRFSSWLAVCSLVMVCLISRTFGVEPIRPESTRATWIPGALGIRSAILRLGENRVKGTTLLIYATPNGNTVEQTFGCRAAPGLDFHFDIQHVGAQTCHYQELIPESNVVLAVVQAPNLSWPNFLRERPRKELVRTLVDSLADLCHANQVILSGHSGGGAFLFAYIDAHDTLPDRLQRIIFLDANYAYDESMRHGEKIITWLQRKEANTCVVIAYDDREIELNGKKVVGPTGGTYRASQRMLNFLRSKGEVIESQEGPFQCQCCSGLNDQLQLYVHRNPENKILHTALVGEMNGLLHGLTVHSHLRETWGSFGGPRAYTRFVRDAPLEASELANATISREAVPRHLSLPPRKEGALLGSEVAAKLTILSGHEREQAIVDEITSGNIPDFLRDLVPICFPWMSELGKIVLVTCHVTSDYLAIGSNTDWIRIPMTPQSARQIAEACDGALISTRISDYIYSAATTRLVPVPLSVRRESVETFVRHHRLIELQLDGVPTRELVCGAKKDVVWDSSQPGNPKNVTLYGWHYPDGDRIQPRYAGHSATYVDYSHGIRLMDGHLIVDGKEFRVEAVRQDPNLKGILIADEK